MKKIKSRDARGKKSTSNQQLLQEVEALRSRLESADRRLKEITDRNIAEEALKISETRYRRLFETARDGILILDAETGQITDVNPFLVEMLGYSYADFLGKQITSIPKETMKALRDYPWPGNIRELESIIERAVILCPGPFLHLADKLEMASFPLPTGMNTLEEVERTQIIKTLLQTQWRIEGKDGAAAILGLHPSTLRARMHKLGIVRSDSQKSE